MELPVRVLSVAGGALARISESPASTKISNVAVQRGERRENNREVTPSTSTCISNRHKKLIVRDSPALVLHVVKCFSSFVGTEDTDDPRGEWENGGGENDGGWNALRL